MKTYVIESECTKCSRDFCYTENESHTKRYCGECGSQLHIVNIMEMEEN